MSGCESFHGLGQSRAGWHLGQHGLVLVQMRREKIGQIKDLAFQKPDGVHLDVVLEALFWWSSPGPLCRGGMGSTARGRRGSPYGRGKGRAKGGSKRGGRLVEMAV